jgi:hypothetical protein
MTMKNSAAMARLATLSAIVAASYARYEYYTDHATGDFDTRWEKAWPQLQLAEKFQVEVGRVETDLRIQNVFSFDSTGDAYDACQTDYQIKKGDLLVIESEKVIGIAHTWPVAVTSEPGALHTLMADSDAKAVLEIPAEFITGAIKAATDRGYSIDANFFGA